ncbi:MAG: glycosyltransferase [Pseudomonadota bacterium]
MKINEYLDFISTKGQRYLAQHIPWDLDGNLCSVDSTIKALVLDAKQSQEALYKPKFSIITPLYNTPPELLENLLMSLKCQSYLNWEMILRDDSSTKKEHLAIGQTFANEDDRFKLTFGEQNLGIGGSRNSCIDMASGDYILIVDHDDLIHPRSLILFWKYLIANPHVSLIYTNECKIDAQGKQLFDFHFKPEFDRFTLLRNNYICHLTCIKHQMCKTLESRDGYLFAQDLDGVEDHDFYIRLTSLSNFNVLHLPLFPYYWRAIEGSTATEINAKPQLLKRREKLLEVVSEKQYGNGHFVKRMPSNSTHFQTVSIFPKLKDTNQAILVIIPFFNNSEITLRCLEKLKQQTASKFLKVCLVDNNSSQHHLKIISDWCAANPAISSKIHSYPYAFNFAKINNQAFDLYSNDCTHVLFLNNDVEIESPDAIEVMAAHLNAHKECAFAGILLKFPSGKIQHGGIRIDPILEGCGQFSIRYSTHAEQLVFEERVAMGVTFACSMSKTGTFQTLGKLDESILPNGYGDVEICLRASKLGLKCHYFGTLEGTHHESLSRSKVNESIEFLYINEKHSSEIFKWRHRSMEFSQTGYSEWESKVRSHPLRYKLADNINDFLKPLGFLHKSIKLLFELKKKLKLRSRYVSEISGIL